MDIIVAKETTTRSCVCARVHRVPIQVWHVDQYGRHEICLCEPWNTFHILISECLLLASSAHKKTHTHNKTKQKQCAPCRRSLMEPHIKCNIGGYGTCHIPTAPGVYDLECVTWKPEGDQTLSFALTGTDSPCFILVPFNIWSCTRPYINAPCTEGSRKQNVLYVFVFVFVFVPGRIFCRHNSQAEGPRGHPDRVQAHVHHHPRRQGRAGCERETHRVDAGYRKFFQRTV